MNNNSIIVNRHLYVDTIKSLPQAELANYNGLRAGFLNGVPVWEGPANIALPMAVGFDGKTSGDTNLFCGSMGGGIGRNSKLYSPEALGFERSDSWKDLPHQGLYVHTFASTPCLNLTNDIKVGHTQNVFCRLAVSLSGSAAPLIKLAGMNPVGKLKKQFVGWSPLSIERVMKRVYAHRIICENSMEKYRLTYFELSDLIVAMSHPFQTFCRFIAWMDLEETVEMYDYLEQVVIKGIVNHEDVSRKIEIPVTEGN